jgi:N-acetylneuraminate lyase
MKFSRIDGLMAATFTPFHADGSLNLECIPAYCRFLKANNVAGAFICGTTGEGSSLTQQERMKIAEAWIAANAGDSSFKIITMVGGNSIADAKELAEHASSIGLDGISFTSPHYFKPTSLEQLAACCMDVASSAPKLPFYYYHIPGLTGVSFPMIGLMNLLHGKLENFAGIKYSEENLVDYIQCLQFNFGAYEILWGKDECLLAALAVGGKSGIGSTYNYAMTLYRQLIASFQAGDLQKSLEHQTQSIRMVSLLGKYGGITGGKAFMLALGIDCGNPRLPLSCLTGMEHTSFNKNLIDIHFEDIRSR